MASELSKLIEDQLQKHDEEAPLSPTEKQRLLSSSLRIKVQFSSGLQLSVFVHALLELCQYACRGLTGRHLEVT